MKISTIEGFQLSEGATVSYITNRMKIITNGAGVFSDQAHNCNRASEDVELEKIDATLSPSREQVKYFGKIRDVDKILATDVKELEATEHVRYSPSWVLAAPQAGR
jgi:hypothetical protein